MIFSEYLDSIESTPNEQLLIQKLADMEGDLSQAKNVPFVGKVIAAMIELGKAQSIADFRQTAHYDNIKNWNITVTDLEKGQFSINPGPEHTRWLIGVFGVVAAIIVLWCLCRKRRKQ